VRLLDVSGEVDIASLDALLVRALRCLEESQSVLEIDLNGVTFIDSSGLGALVRIRNEAAARGTDVTLVSTPDSVKRLLELSGLSTIFDIQSRD
jgi:anti-sigma B factor antagonist